MNQQITKMPNNWLRWATVANFDGTAHFHRLPLFMWGRFRIYLHHFAGPDDCRDPHDHPATFVSVGLWGSYTERVYYRGRFKQERTFRAPFIRRFEYRHAHQITRVRNAWTLVVTYGRERPWGYWTPDGQWSTADVYIERLNKENPA